MIIRADVKQEVMPRGRQQQVAAGSGSGGGSRQRNAPCAGAADVAASRATPSRLRLATCGSAAALHCVTTMFVGRLPLRPEATVWNGRHVLPEAVSAIAGEFLRLMDAMGSPLLSLLQECQRKPHGGHYEPQLASKEGMQPRDEHVGRRAQVAPPPPPPASCTACCDGAASQLHKQSHGCTHASCAARRLNRVTCRCRLLSPPDSATAWRGRQHPLSRVRRRQTAATQPSPRCLPCCAAPARTAPWRSPGPAGAAPCPPTPQAGRRRRRREAPPRAQARAGPARGLLVRGGALQAGRWVGRKAGGQLSYPHHATSSQQPADHVQANTTAAALLPAPHRAPHPTCRRAGGPRGGAAAAALAASRQLRLLLRDLVLRQERQRVSRGPKAQHIGGEIDGTLWWVGGVGYMDGVDGVWMGRGRRQRREEGRRSGRKERALSGMAGSSRGAGTEEMLPELGRGEGCRPGTAPPDTHTPTTTHTHARARARTHTHTWCRFRFSSPNRNSMPSWSSTVMETGKKWAPAFTCTMWMRPGGQTGGRKAQQARRGVGAGVQAAWCAWGRGNGEAGDAGGARWERRTRSFRQASRHSLLRPAAAPRPSPSILAEPTPTAVPCQRRSMRRSRLQRSAHERLMMVICAGGGGGWVHT